jgi:hypothetical protein
MRSRVFAGRSVELVERLGVAFAGPGPG